MNKLQPLKPMPPRRFPKGQYQKLSHHIWALTIGTVIIVILFGTLFITAIKFTNRPVFHHVAHHVKSSRLIRKPKSITHRSGHLNITPIQGEKLLGHWLIKLHYSPNESREALINYQKSNQIQEKVLSQRLTDHQSNQIREIINHELLGTKVQVSNSAPVQSFWKR